MNDDVAERFRMEAHAVREATGGCLHHGDHADCATDARNLLEALAEPCEPIRVVGMTMPWGELNRRQRWQVRRASVAYGLRRPWWWLLDRLAGRGK